MRYLLLYSDVICFVAAIAFAIAGFFLLNFIAGIFAISVGLVLFGLLLEAIFAPKQQTQQRK